MINVQMIETEWIPRRFVILTLVIRLLIRHSSFNIRHCATGCPMRRSQRKCDMTPPQNVGWELYWRP
jgi:hypothetical protein